MRFRGSRCSCDLSEARGERREARLLLPHPGQEAAGEFAAWSPEAAQPVCGAPVSGGGSFLLLPVCLLNVTHGCLIGYQGFAEGALDIYSDPLLI